MPPCLILFAETLNTIVYFKPLEHELIARQLRNFYQMQAAVEFVKSIGIMFLGIVAIALLILLLLIIKLFSAQIEKLQKIVTEILKSLMWGAVLRLLLQGYYMMAL